MFESHRLWLIYEVPSAFTDVLQKSEFWKNTKWYAYLFKSYVIFYRLKPLEQSLQFKSKQNDECPLCGN